ncbi:gamma-aminobutyric acid receptor subunit beta-like isoform X1 [Mercenaria mercenaria]|uniref:gamma-aminobutyric acid receptor subunit beta-like isoform X1 n=1 Tax=Mercenaria mercenaria TaxID=6596 RepID=UPI00234F7756|nr:gamma-aminobutyric acid receptor subunit beta-like isoform X1 [Mercenaria mercenaria]
MYDAGSESSEHSYIYEILKSTVNLKNFKTGISERSDLDTKMWSPSKTTRNREHVFPHEDSEETRKSHSRQETNNRRKEDDSMLNALFSRLVESIDRNTEVMQCAMETMDTLSRSSNRTPLPDDTDFIIPDAKRPDKVLVELKCTFLKINDIDTINQQFEAELFVQAKWEEPLLQQSMFGSKDKDGEDLDKLIPWDPKLIVMNIDGAFVLNRKTFDIRLHEPGYRYPVVIQLWRFKGFFKENLELEHFPVDVQDLTISLSTERSDKEVDLIEDQTSLSSINTKAFMDQEWSLYKHIETSRDFTTVEYCSSTVHPILHAQCRVARKMGYFVWNIIFIMLLIISLTFAAFTIDFNSADRITVTITLFLTAVAFKLVVKQSLPTISYLTYLDVYVIAALIFLGLQAAQNATMNALGHFMIKGEVQYYDKWSMVLMAIILIVFHIFFALFIYRTASKRRRIMEEKDRMYIGKREFLEKFGTLPPRYNNGVSDFDYDSIIPGRKMKTSLPR